MIFRADLHIHSCLSPCGSLEMSPRAIVDKARKLGLNALALTDHNSSRNAPTFAKLCAQAGVCCLSGLEITTREEAHLLCLFDTPEEAARLEKHLEKRMPHVAFDPEKLGDQVYVNERDEILGDIPWRLETATDCTLEELIDCTLSWGGMCIPAHVNRPAFSIPAQLGFLPDLPYSAVEVSASADFAAVRRQFAPHAIVTGSDAHYAHNIGRGWIEIQCERFACNEISHALQNSRPLLRKKEDLPAIT